MDKSLTTKLVTLVLAVFIIIMIASQLFISSNNTLKTEIAMRYDSMETVEFDGVFVRNEHTVEREYDGVIRYTHGNGSKLGLNSEIAGIYKSAADIETTVRLERLQEKINALSDAQNLAGTDNSQIESFNKLITEKHHQMITAIDNEDYKTVSKLKYEILNLQAKRDMVKGKITDYSGIIEGLKQKSEELGNSVSAQPESLISGETGYFVNCVDGYESVLNSENISKLTPEEIEKIVANPVLGNTGRNVIGKMIDSYKCKIVAVLDENGATAVTENLTVNLVCGAGPGTVSATVQSVEKYPDGKYVVIFSSDEIENELSAERTERFKLLIDSYNGIRITSSAIHFDKDNNIGVYVKVGVECIFKRIEKIYSGDGYVIARDTTGNTGYLSLYDTIITEGKDLYDGKIL